jgi:GT2 family glycosyltransferase
LTCHDRRETTLACLERLHGQRLENVRFRVFLVDDASSDGTSEAVGTRFPRVRILPGTGALYWGGGMRLAFRAARNAAEQFTHYLFLNDDTMLVTDALARLLETQRQLGNQGDREVIVVGSLSDPVDGRLAYGGVRRLWPLPFFHGAAPGRHPRRCSTMHGNCALLPESVASSVGNLDPAFTHCRGDFDYGLRARDRGIQVWIAPGYFGTCRFAPVGGWRARPLSWRERLDALRHPKYAIDEKVLFARRHHGPLWFLSPVAVYVYLVLLHAASWPWRFVARRSGPPAESGEGSSGEP